MAGSKDTAPGARSDGREPGAFAFSDALLRTTRLELDWQPSDLPSGMMTVTLTMALKLSEAGDFLKDIDQIRTERHTLRGLPNGSA